VSGSHSVNRRDFVKVVLTSVGGLMGTIIGIPALGYLISPALKVEKTEGWISVGPLVKYEIGKPTLFTFTRSKTNGWEKTVNSYGVYVIKKSETEADIISNMCTHLSCRVNWKEEREMYICPCHDGHFAKDGAALNTVVSKPLKRYAETKIEDGSLLFHFIEKEG
jgi:menaquinol-cytochrome c reductase iron-sulfur subunit